MIKKSLTAEEAREVKKLLRQKQPGFEGYEAYDQTIQLASGRRSSWGPPGWYPATATACSVPGKNAIQLRLDYVVDDFTDNKVPVTSQLFEIAEGTSAVSQLTNDAVPVVWLLTPSLIESKVAGNPTTKRR